MRHGKHTFEVKGSVATGTSQRVADWTDKVVVHWTTDWNATAILQGTIDGTNWIDIETVTGTGSAVQGIIDVWGAFLSLRWDTTAWVAGAMSSQMGYRDARSD